MVKTWLKVAGVAAASVLVTLAGQRWMPPVRCDLTRNLLASCDWIAFHYATMRRDLRALQELQEAHRSRYWGYALHQRDLDFIPSPGVQVDMRSGYAGWAARTWHHGLYMEGCAVYNWRWDQHSGPRGLVEGDEAAMADEIYCTD